MRCPVRRTSGGRWELAPDWPYRSHLAFALLGKLASPDEAVGSLLRIPAGPLPAKTSDSLTGGHYTVRRMVTTLLTVVRRALIKPTSMGASVTSYSMACFSALSTIACNFLCIAPAGHEFRLHAHGADAQLAAWQAGARSPCQAPNFVGPSRFSMSNVDDAAGTAYGMPSEPGRLRHLRAWPATLLPNLGRLLRQLL